MDLAAWNNEHYRDNMQDSKRTKRRSVEAYKWLDLSKKISDIFLKIQEEAIKREN